MFMKFDSTMREKIVRKNSHGNVILESCLTSGIGNKKSIEIFKKGTVLRNAHDTTGDVVHFDGKRYDSMIQVWREMTDESNLTCSACGATSDLVGAHVVSENASPHLRRGDKVYIIPLCEKCNHCTRDTIRLVRDTKAVPLIWDGIVEK